MRQCDYVSLCKLIGHAEQQGRYPEYAIVGEVEEGETFIVEEAHGVEWKLPLRPCEGLEFPILVSYSEPNELTILLVEPKIDG
jgi:hypothetical protein